MQALVETHDYDPIKDDRIRAFAQPKPVAKRMKCGVVGMSERARSSTSYLPTLASLPTGVQINAAQTPTSTSSSSAIDVGSKTSLPATTSTDEKLPSALPGLVKLLIPLALAYVLASIDDEAPVPSRTSETQSGLGVSQADFIRSSFWISYTVLSFPLTVVAGLLRRQQMFPALFFLMGIGNLCLAFSSRFAQLLVVKAILGAASAGVLPALLLALAQKFDSIKHTGLVLALILAFGRTVSGLLYVLCRAPQHQATCFIVLGGISLLSVAGSYFLLAPPRSGAVSFTELGAELRSRPQLLERDEQNKSMEWKTIFKAANKPIVVVTGTLILPTTSMVSATLFSTQMLTPSTWRGLILVLAPAAFLVLLSIVALKWQRTRMVLVLLSALVQLLGTALFVGSFGPNNQLMQTAGAIVGCMGGAPIVPLSLAYLLGISNQQNSEQDQLWWRVGLLGPALTGIGLGRIVHIWAPHLPQIVQVVGILSTTSLCVIAIAFWTAFASKEKTSIRRRRASPDATTQSATISVQSEPKTGADSVTTADTSSVVPPTIVQNQIA